MRYLNFIQSILPSSCLLCDNQGLLGKDICSYCLENLEKNLICCAQCGETLEQIGKACGRCLKNPPYFDCTHAPFEYLGAMRYLISTLKFNRQYKNARLLGSLLADFLQYQTAFPECIIPIPLHSSRYRQRGFNQSLEIGKTLAKQLQLPIVLDACIRHKNTPHQIGLTNKQRLKNVKNAFMLTKSLDYQHVAILDDVMTTGATANELARVLKKAGVQRVDVWVCARA